MRGDKGNKEWHVGKEHLDVVPGAPEREKGPFHLQGKKVVRKGFQEDVNLQDEKALASC